MSHPKLDTGRGRSVAHRPDWRPDQELVLVRSRGLPLILFPCGAAVAQTCGFMCSPRQFDWHQRWQTRRGWVVNAG